MALVAAIVLPLLLAAGGGAIDFYRVLNEKTAMQDVVDSAALAGAKALGVQGATTAEVQTDVNEFLAANASPLSIQSETVNVDTSAGLVTVNATTSLPTYFAGVIGLKQIPVTATAAAKAGNAVGQPVCVGVLNSSMPTALGASGSAGLNAAPCDVWVNSTSASAVSLSGSASITAAKNCFMGGVTTSGAASVSAAPSKCGAFSDPFAGMNPTTSSSCDFNNYADKGTATLSPGVYCGGISLSGNSSATLQPGTYVLRNGSLSLSGSSGLTGDGVVFVLEGSSKVDLSGSGAVHLTAPTTGPLAGFVFFQRPTASPGATSTLSGSSGLFIEGVAYFPTQGLSLSGSSSSTNPSPFTAYLADHVQFSGSSGITVNYDPSHITVPVPSGLFTQVSTPVLVR